jgi:hypothetical protein
MKVSNIELAKAIREFSNTNIKIIYEKVKTMRTEEEENKDITIREINRIINKYINYFI